MCLLVLLKNEGTRAVVVAVVVAVVAVVVSTTSLLVLRQGGDVSVHLYGDVSVGGHLPHLKILDFSTVTALVFYKSN